MLDLLTCNLASTIQKVKNQRIQEICDARPELLENRDGVVIWQQEVQGNPFETIYIIELFKKEIARFSVYYEVEKTIFNVIASVPVFSL